MTSERLLNTSIEVIHLPKTFIPPQKKSSGYNAPDRFYILVSLLVNFLFRPRAVD